MALNLPPFGRWTLRDKAAQRRSKRGQRGIKFSLSTTKQTDTDPNGTVLNGTVFGNLRNSKRLDRYTLRGQQKVDGQWALYCMVHNIEKLAHHGLGM